MHTFALTPHFVMPTGAGLGVGKPQCRRSCRARLRGKAEPRRADLPPASEHSMPSDGTLLQQATTGEEGGEVVCVCLCYLTGGTLASYPGTQTTFYGTLCN